MHVALCNNWYPPHTGYGGVAMYDWYLSRALVALGHRSTVVASRWSPDVPEFEIVDGVFVHRLLVKDYPWSRRIPGLRRYGRGFLQYRYSQRVAKLLRELEPRPAEDRIDVVEFAEVGAEGYCYLRRNDRLPVVVRCHTPTAVLRRHYSTAEMAYGTRSIEARENYCIRKAERVTAPSNDMAAVVSDLCDIPREHLSVVPNLLDTRSFHVSERDGPTHGEGVVVLHVGRLERIKGIEVLVDAIPLILAKAPECRFLFLGDDLPRSEGGTWARELNRRLKARGCDDRVTFLGPRSQEELLERYRTADIAVVPTLNYESFSYTCCEAMAAELPVVASRIGGIPETVEDGVTGILVPPADARALASSILALAGDRDRRRRMGAAGRLRASRLFDSSVVARRMIDVYDEAIHAYRAKHSATLRMGEARAR